MSSFLSLLPPCRTVLLGTTEGNSQKNDGWGPRPLLAPCVPCSCNNHSDVCDSETGQCLVCLLVWELTSVQRDLKDSQEPGRPSSWSLPHWCCHRSLKDIETSSFSCHWETGRVCFCVSLSHGCLPHSSPQ